MALNVADHILDSLERLEQFPDSGSMTPDPWLNNMGFRMVISDKRNVSFLPSSRECTYHIGIAKLMNIDRDNSEDFIYVNANDFPDGCADIHDAQAFLDNYQSTLMGRKAKYINAEEYSDIVETEDIPYPWQ